MSINELHGYLHLLSPEIVSSFTFVFAAISMLLLLRYFSIAGLYVFMAVTYITANIQVMNAAEFSFLPHPVALGTILFGLTFCVSDIITECFGPKQARAGVILSFCSLLMITILMHLNLGLEPLNNNYGTEYDNFRRARESINILFSQMPGVFLASIIAYMTSQFCDIYIFDALHRRMGENYLWLRANISTILSVLLDNTIFSVLAWVVFSPTPVDMQTLMFTYIFGTALIRCSLTIVNTPLIYAAKHIVNRNV